MDGPFLTCMFSGYVKHVPGAALRAWRRSLHSDILKTYRLGFNQTNQAHPCLSTSAQSQFPEIHQLVRDASYHGAMPGC